MFFVRGIKEVKIFVNINISLSPENGKVPSLNYAEISKDFEKWLRNKISQETAERYLGILDGLADISVESLINLYEERPANNVAKAIRNLLNYLEEKKLITKEIADEVRKSVQIKKGKSDKVIPTDDDIKEAFEHYAKTLNKKYYQVALLLLYSGARLRHILRMLEELDNKYLELNGSFARYEINHFTMSNKDGFYIYMPSWLAGKLEKAKIPESTAKTKKIRYRASSGRPVTAKYIRKWFNNYLAKLKIEKDVRNFIMGRPSEISKSVEGDYYLELRELADEAYKLVLEKFPVNVLPI
ncbi:integrase [Archaeoglobus sp.]